MTSAVAARTVTCLVMLMPAACGRGSPATPLANAVRAGDLAAIDGLVSAGADVNEPSGVNDWPPVIHAIHKGQRSAMRKLLERGASLDGHVGQTALLMASGYGDAETLAVLLTRGVAMPDSIPAAGELIAAAIGGAWDIDYSWSGCDRHTAVARLLVSRDSDLRVVGILSPTSLARAKSTFKYRVARWYAQRKGCDELLRVVGRGEG